MRDLRVTAGVPALVSLATMLYTTGGRAALARRAIKQDLEIASTLPKGPAHEIVVRMAEEKTVLYAGRWVGPQRPGIKSHGYMGAISAGGFAVAWAGQWLSDVGESNTMVLSLSLLLMLGGLGVAVGCITAWTVLMITSENAQSRVEFLATSRDRVTRHLEGQTSEREQDEGPPDQGQAHAEHHAGEAGTAHAPDNEAGEVKREQAERE